MGEVIALIIVLVIAGAGVSATLVWAARLTRERELTHTPAPALTRATDVAEKLRQQYKLSQRAVRVLEAVVTYDRAIPTLTPDLRREAEAIIEEFYDQ